MDVLEVVGRPADASPTHDTSLTTTAATDAGCPEGAVADAPTTFADASSTCGACPTTGAFAAACGATGVAEGTATAAVITATMLHVMV